MFGLSPLRLATFCSPHPPHGNLPCPGFATVPVLLADPQANPSSFALCSYEVVKAFRRLAKKEYQNKDVTCSAMQFFSRVLMPVMSISSARKFLGGKQIAASPQQSDSRSSQSREQKLQNEVANLKAELKKRKEGKGKGEGKGTPGQRLQTKAPIPASRSLK